MIEEKFTKRETFCKKQIEFIVKFLSNVFMKLHNKTNNDK